MSAPTHAAVTVAAHGSLAPSQMQKYFRKYALILLILVIYQTRYVWDLISLDSEAANSPETVQGWNKAKGESDMPRELPGVVFDPLSPHFRPLQNREALGQYKNSDLRVPEHIMDAVILASAPDATLALSVHNLFHLCGFRRFIFIVNNATADCVDVFDLVPQHNMSHPHVCLDHTSFYTEEERHRIETGYPTIHRGAPQKNKRGNLHVHVPRMGWYLQQFSKYLVARAVPDLSQNYLAIDGDLILTRPYNFTLASGKFPMPKTSKNPQQWHHFVRRVMGNETLLADSNNYVVGWMVMDRPILGDLIHSIDQVFSDDPMIFPFNILNEAERVLNDTLYFSEFYLYARYALTHPSQIYVPTKHREPSRNPGNFRYTCTLSKHQYESVQSDSNKAPWLIWEEHKQHAFNVCPDGDSAKLTKLSNIGIWHDFHPSPWGGGNQFLLALREGLRNDHFDVLAKNDENGHDRIQNNSQVLLANSITFKGGTGVLKDLKARNQLGLVHRVDGPYFVARYFQSLNFTDPPKLPREDKQTKQINRNYACATVFQSSWSLNANIKIGLNLRNPVIVPNTINPDVFFPRPHRLDSNRKVRIVASSHSNNQRKGFDTMLWVDQNLDFERYEFVYMGGIPLDDSFQPKRIQLLKSKGSEDVSAFLRTGDIYFAPSRFEPASNAVMEALACGLPIVYQEGSSHGDLVGGAGVGFAKAGPEVLTALEQVVANYEKHVEAIHVPSLEDVTKGYLSVMRWCFYMKHTILPPSTS